MIGDGEFQEGQIFESLQSIPQQKLNDIIVIMDHNKIQSSEFVKKIIDLKDLRKKIESFGWYVQRCNGHSFKEIERVLKKIKKINNKPRFLIADTIKGKGVNFMEHSSVMKNNKYYNWHAGAPNDFYFEKAQEILLKKVQKKLIKKNIEKLKVTNIASKKNNTKIFEIH